MFVIKQNAENSPVFPEYYIKNRMAQVLKTDHSQINHILDYLLESSGKMIRPRLIYHTASMYPYNKEKIVDIAVAVELIHLASLVHDDVIDRSDCRRGKESINYLFGNHASVLTGDYLFAAAFNLLAKWNEPVIMDNITTTIQVMCSGEIKQFSLQGLTRVSEEDYFDKTYRKTACLFASSCKTGALAAGAPSDEEEIIERFGLYLGYAYQVIDDVLDFIADSVELGKPVGNDLTQGNITLPVILALKNKKYGSRLNNLIEKGKISSETMPAVVDMLNKCGAIEESVEYSRAFMKNAIETIEKLSPRDYQSLKTLGVKMLENYYKQAVKTGTTERWSQSGNA